MSKPFKAVCALDSFKGSLGSLEAGEAAKEGILQAAPNAEVEVLPIADGGEGTLEALTWQRGKTRHTMNLTAADHETPVTAHWGTLKSAADINSDEAKTGRCDAPTTAVLESAETIGINQVLVDENLPVKASSYSFGLMVVEALQHGVDEVLVTLGGSATTDGGTGVFQALGAVLFDEGGVEIPVDTNPLWNFESADFSGMQSLEGVQIAVLNDVLNPMCGSEGAAATFGPQKGATATQVIQLNTQLGKWGKTLEEAFGVPILSSAGAGAAGGLGGAFLALGGEMQPGFDRVAHELQLAKVIQGADLIITGEGSLDWQSAYGKVPAGVGKLAKEAGVIAVGLAGRINFPLGKMGDVLDAVFPIHSAPMPLKDALDPQITACGIKNTAKQVTRLFLAASN